MTDQDRPEVYLEQQSKSAESKEPSVMTFPKQEASESLLLTPSQRHP